MGTAQDNSDELLRQTSQHARRLLEQLQADRADLSMAHYRIDPAVAAEGLQAIDRVIACAQELLRQANDTESKATP